MPKRPHDAVVGDQFGPRANAYLASPVHAHGEDLNTLARIIGARPVDGRPVDGRPGAVALDLGCGGGHTAYLLAPLVGRIVAYDLSDAMLATVAAEAARRDLPNLETRQGSAEQLPWDGASFDIVVSRYSAHHWRDVAAGLREARRVLKPGGLAVFMDAVAPESPLLDTWLQCLELLRDPSHVRDYRVAEWRAMARDAGFQPGDVSRYRLRLEFASWVGRMNTPETHVTAIRSLAQAAGAEVSRYFEIEADGSFTIDTMLMTAGG